MAKGYRGGGMPGGMNMNNLMKQAQKMQKQMEEAQESLGNKELEVTSGGGAVKVVITGKKEIKEISISPDVVDPDDIEMLQDLVMTAVNEAIRQVEEVANNEIGKITGGTGSGLGGLF
ncbi:MAG: YbaB/EbfC family nucleoid-associated protein [Lachnospirales bacterium]